MNQTISERRLAENEAYFREQNEQVERELEMIRQIAMEEGKLGRLPNHDKTTFHFYCECSDENCRQRIAITLDSYVAIHKNRHRFMIVPGHQVDAIEHIVKKESDYWVIEKTIPVPENVTHLKPTPIDNS